MSPASRRETTRPRPLPPCLPSHRHLCPSALGHLASVLFPPYPLPILLVHAARRGRPGPRVRSGGVVVLAAAPGAAAAAAGSVEFSPVASPAPRLCDLAATAAVGLARPITFSASVAVASAKPPTAGVVASAASPAPGVGRRGRAEASTTEAQPDDAAATLGVVGASEREPGRIVVVLVGLVATESAIVGTLRPVDVSPPVRLAAVLVTDGLHCLDHHPGLPLPWAGPDAAGRGAATARPRRKADP